MNSCVTRGAAATLYLPAGPRRLVAVGVASCPNQSRRALARQSLPKNDRCKFGTIVRALWPDKPALNLAQRIGCSERAAQFYIDGHRKITARAAAVILVEMLN